MIDYSRVAKYATNLGSGLLSTTNFEIMSLAKLWQRINSFFVLCFVSLPQDNSLPCYNLLKCQDLVSQGAYIRSGKRAEWYVMLARRITNVARLVCKLNSALTNCSLSTQTRDPARRDAGVPRHAPYSSKQNTEQKRKVYPPPPREYPQVPSEARPPFALILQRNNDLHRIITAH